MSRVWRSYRFTALAQLADPNAWAGPGAMPSQVTAAMHDGYQRGMERGYREGHEAGMRSGMDTRAAPKDREEGRQQGSTRQAGSTWLVSSGCRHRSANCSNS